MLIFKFVCLLKNLDILIDMGDGVRLVCFVKYELLIFNKINKIKYVIGCVYLIILIEEMLLSE